MHPILTETTKENNQFAADFPTSQVAAIYFINLFQLIRFKYHSFCNISKF